MQLRRRRHALFETGRVEWYSSSSPSNHQPYGEREPEKIVFVRDLVSPNCAHLFQRIHPSCISVLYTSPSYTDLVRRRCRFHSCGALFPKVKRFFVMPKVSIADSFSKNEPQRSRVNPIHHNVERNTISYIASRFCLSSVTLAPKTLVACLRD